MTEETKHLKSQTLFENMTFEEYFNEKDLSIIGDVEFRSCIFKKPFTIDNLEIKGDLVFNKCLFTDSTTLKNCSAKAIVISDSNISVKDLKLISNIASRLDIEDLIGNDIYINGNYNLLYLKKIEANDLVLKDLNSDYSPNESKIEITNLNIKKLEIKGISIYADIFFKSGIFENIFLIGQFNNVVNIKDNVKVDNLFFESSTFNDRIDIRGGDFEYIYFYRSIFKKLVYVNSYDILSNSHNELAIKSLTIHANLFEENVSISLIEIDSINVSDNQFNKTLSLNNFNSNNSTNNDSIKFALDGVNQGNIVIEKAFVNIDLSGINFGIISFKNIHIDFLQFDEFQNDGKVSFSNSLPEGYLTVENSTLGKTLFLNTNINDFKEIVISDSNIEESYFSTYPNRIRSYSKNPKFGFGIKDKSRNIINLRNTFNQLKQVAKKNGDIDVANKYQAFEYKNLLLSKKISLDSILLALNWASNNNGQSWLRGILFTVSIALLFFYFYTISLAVFYDHTYFIEDYIIFLTSFPKLQLEKFSHANDTWEVSLIIWLSRIFISYGIYQTVSAFRKYGKA